jgi:molybdate/tungstate transport system substrate-binding protein
MRTAAFALAVLLLSLPAAWAGGNREASEEKTNEEKTKERAGESGKEQEVSGVLTIFHAGSLTVPFSEMEKEMEERYPQLDVQREAAGSTASARKISELGKQADIMASADYTVIDKILIPEFAELNIRFATNQLVLCYTESSRYADEVNSDNWHEILRRDEVVWGHSDPNLDPCGYRSLMVMQLAEEYYGIEDLYRKLLENRPKKNVRPKSVDLISLLQSGNMDYAWEYLSVAEQHGLEYVTLPEKINLGNYRHDQYYSRATVEVTGKKPDEKMTLRGKSITYGITLVKNRPNPEAAGAFLEYLFDPDGGLKILENMGQPPFVPVRVPTEEMYGKVPARLKDLVEVKQ